MAHHFSETSPSAHRRFAVIACALIIAVFVLSIWPYAARPAPIIAPFLPLFAMAVFLTEGLTAFLLWAQWSVSGSLFYAALAGAYAFAALSAACQLVVFPGVFSPGGLLGAGQQSAIWIWVIWHAGFPSFVALAMLVRQRHPGPLDTASTRERIVAATLAGGACCLAALLCAAAIYFKAALPALVAGSSYQRLSSNVVGVGVAAVNAGAFVIVLGTTRLRTRIDVWIAVALMAALADVSLTLIAGARYSVGWYAARLMSVFASSSVLSMLVWEISHLYYELQAANRKLTEVTERDGLTTIFNRRYFDRQYAKVLADATMSDRPLSVLMVDIDYFKQYNDAFGHLAGDECLARVAQALQSSLQRTSEFVARIGGEEFVVVLPECASDSAIHVATQLCEAIEALGICAPHSPNGSVTVSIGVASADRPRLETKRDLVDEADRQLYRAKALGRNRIAGGVTTSAATTMI